MCLELFWVLMRQQKFLSAQAMNHPAVLARYFLTPYATGPCLPLILPARAAVSIAVGHLWSLGHQVELVCVKPSKKEGSKLTKSLVNYVKGEGSNLPIHRSEEHTSELQSH